MLPVICFISDFGFDDAWVGVCHATIYRDCPQARVVDLAHHIPPFDLRKGAVVAASGAWQLPWAIHLVAVDPGVGGGRHDLCLVTADGTRLVGPDNGVLIPATWRSGGVAEAYAIDPSVLSAAPPLPTFHARDVMAPAVAALASGVEPSALGEAIDPGALVTAPFQPSREEEGTIVGEILDVDRFGSVRIGIGADELESTGGIGKRAEIAFGHLTLEVPLGRTFSDVEEGEPVLLIDSSGWLTLSVRKDSAADRYSVEPGAAVHVRVGGEPI
jgi:S-adenosylmethionine hydrolase